MSGQETLVNRVRKLSLPCLGLQMAAYTEYSFYDYYPYRDNATDNASFDFNITVDCPGSNLHGTNIFLPILYYVIFFTGFLGNLFVISVMSSRGRRGGRLVDMFVLHLALADLIFVLTLPLWAYSAGQNGYWEFGRAGDLLCKLSSFIIAVNRSSNIFFLTCMSIDRYLAVVKLLRSSYLRSSRHSRAICAVVWLSSLVLGIPSLVYRRVELSGPGLSCMDNNNSYFFLGLSLTMVLLTFIFPHCVATVNPRRNARFKHSLKMVLSIIVAFVVSWLPFNIFKVIMIGSQLSNVDLTCGAPSWQRKGLLISCCLAFLNSCVNPAIYFFLDHHFRQRAKILLQACRGRPKSTQSHKTSTSCSNVGTSESFGTASGRTQLQMSE
uniref:G-protein coupled receptors family 1 profile domain-containing protein n=1 Tax=Mola mola TaxID=94237 RepID=A0A3Q3VQA0_MOLML